MKGVKNLMIAEKAHISTVSRAVKHKYWMVGYAAARLCCNFQSSGGFTIISALQLLFHASKQ